MSALGYYISTCQYVIRCNPSDPDSLSELRRFVLALRHSLACCVCGQIVHKPRVALDAGCQHNVCEGCVGGKMKTKGPCTRCKNYETFVENKELAIVVQCFKKLCEYVVSSAMAANLSAGNCSASSLQGIIQEGLNISDSYSSIHANNLEFPPPPKLESSPVKLGKTRKRRKRRFSLKGKFGPRTHFGSSHCLEACSISSQNLEVNHVENGATACESQRDGLFGPATEKSEIVGNGEICEDSGCGASCLQSGDDVLSPESDFTDGSLCRVTSEHDYTREPCENGHEICDENQTKLTSTPSRKNTEKQTHVVKISKDKLSLFPEINQDETDTNEALQNRNKSGKFSRKGTGCRCGLATANPGKLTCCGQRCPCYSSFKGCYNCRCRGCRNPRGDPSKIPNLLQPQLIHDEKDESDIEIDI